MGWRGGGGGYPLGTTRGGGRPPHPTQKKLNLRHNLPLAGLDTSSCGVGRGWLWSPCPQPMLPLGGGGGLRRSVVGGPCPPIFFATGGGGAGGVRLHPPPRHIEAPPPAPAEIFPAARKEGSRGKEEAKRGLLSSILASWCYLMQQRTSASACISCSSCRSPSPVPCPCGSGGWGGGG